MTGAGVEICTNVRQVKRDLAWGVGTVDDAQQPGGTRAAAEGLHRKRQGSGAGDVTEEDDLRPLGNPAPECLHEGIGISDWERDGLTHVACPGLATEKVPGAIHRSILVIGGEDLVLWTQLQAARYHVDGGCWIG